jgi:hypothetical protein
MLGQPLFPGDSNVDQLVEIIKVVGTPTREEIQAMNQNYTEFKFPQIKAHPWSKVCVWGGAVGRAAGGGGMCDMMMRTCDNKSMCSLAFVHLYAFAYMFITDISTYMYSSS